MARPVVTLLVALSFGCGGTQSPTSGPVDLPTIQGRPIYSSALVDAPPAVATVWADVEEALLVASHRGDDWGVELGRLVQRLDPEWGRLDQGTPDEVLFSAVTQALVLNELALWFSQEFGNEVRTRDAAAGARRVYAICVRQAPSATELLRDWGGTCLERSRALEPLTDAREPLDTDSI